MKKPLGFKKILHERITARGMAEVYAKVNGYPKYHRTKK